MKISLTILFILFMTNASAQAMPQSEPGRVIDAVPSTEEEKFYEGEQVNPEAFEEDRQEEEEMPYQTSDEVYPYEGSEIDDEEEYLEDNF